MNVTVALLKADRIVARADKNQAKFALLTNVIGDYELAKSAPKNLAKSEWDVLLPVLQKALTDSKASVEAYKKVGAASHQERASIDVILLESYVPENLSEEEIEEMVAEFKAEGKKMPDFMQHLRQNYTNLFDGGMASTIAKRELV